MTHKLSLSIHISDHSWHLLCATSAPDMFIEVYLSQLYLVNMQEEVGPRATARRDQPKAKGNALEIPSRHAHYSYALPPEFPPGGQEYLHSEDKIITQRTVRPFNSAAQEGHQGGWTVLFNRSWVFRAHRLCHHRRRDEEEKRQRDGWAAASRTTM